jgi:hypothetical protein
VLYLIMKSTTLSLSNIPGTIDETVSEDARVNY